MPNPENIKGKGNRFSSTNQPKNPGRKPSLYNHIKKLLGSDIVAGTGFFKKNCYFFVFSAMFAIFAA